MANATTEGGAVEQALAVLAALGTSVTPDVRWIHDDGLCDCTFQRIGEWTNPYIARTLRVRMCCLWEQLYAQYPEYVQRIDAYYDTNRDRYVAEPQPWNSEEMPMPVSLWHRQIATATGKTLEEVRAEYAGREHERPQPVAPGTYPKDVPTPEEMHAALENKLRAGTWILPEERLA